MRVHVLQYFSVTMARIMIILISWMSLASVAIADACFAEKPGMVSIDLKIPLNTDMKTVNIVKEDVLGVRQIISSITIQNGEFRLDTFRHHGMRHAALNVRHTKDTLHLNLALPQLNKTVDGPGRYIAYIASPAVQIGTDGISVTYVGVTGSLNGQGSQGFLLVISVCIAISIAGLSISGSHKVKQLWGRMFKNVRQYWDKPKLSVEETGQGWHLEDLATYQST